MIYNLRSTLEVLNRVVKILSSWQILMITLYILWIRLILNFRVLLRHMQSKVARKSPFDGEQTCRLAFILLICFGGGGGRRVLGFVCFLISPSSFLNHETRPKKGHRIPNEANLTEWERNPEITRTCRLAAPRARSWILTLINHHHTDASENELTMLCQEILSAIKFERSLISWLISLAIQSM